MEPQRLVLLNALPISAMFPPSATRLTLKIRRIAPEELKSVVENRTIANYIRHESTVRALSFLIGQELKVSNGFYSYIPGDRTVVVVLKSGAAPRGAEVQVTPEQLEYYLVEAFPE